jgi:hypothetical protein
MAGGGKNPAPSGQTTQTTNQQPWSVQQPYLENAFAGAQQLYGTGGPQYYPNATYATPVSAQIGGLNDMWSTGATLNAESNIPLSLMNSVLNGQFMQGNPALGPLSQLGQQNYGQNNLGTQGLAGLAYGNTGYDTHTPYGGLIYAGGNNAARLNPAFDSLSSLAGQGAGSILQNPYNVLSFLSNTNQATQNPAYGMLGQIGQQGADLSNPNNVLNFLANTNQATQNSAYGALGNLATSGASGLSGPLSDLQRIAGRGGTGLSRPLGALESYASGSQTNPYLDQLSKTTLAGVLPNIQKQFIEGGSLSSPQAAYASSQGASAALAPVLNQAFQQEQQNQINAANMEGNLRLGRGQLQTQAGQAAANAMLGQAGVQTQAANALGNQYLTGAGQAANAAGLMGNLGLGNIGARTQAANALGGQYLTGAGQAANAAGTLGNLALGNAGLQSQTGLGVGNQLLQGQGMQNSALSNALSAATGLGGLQQTAGANLGNLAIGGQNAQTNALNALANAYGTSVDQITKTLALYPQTAQGALTGSQAEVAAGGGQQALNQQAINDAIQRWNYGQTQPYQNLSNFLGNISGNYGGTLTQSNPYYLNKGANLMSGLTGGAALGSTLGALAPEMIGSGAGALGGAGLGALLAFI